MKTLPTLVAKLVTCHDAWIVGSAADPINTTPRDYDVQVPYSAWGQASQLIPAGTPANSFGGFKCVSDGVEVDVWPGELGWILQRPQCRFAYHPASGTRVTKCAEERR